ncbi:MAG: glycosyltransferase, partial [Myxococcales bacterium]|nr:glycosyltransferase [Myxococcales bacterium]
APRRPGQPPRVLFPASTLGRKGAYTLREALQGLPVALVLGGPVLEGEGFWGRDTRRGGLDDADLVVAPAHVEPAPRRLLAALAQGLPVIASHACGLDPEPGLTLVPPGDAHALRDAIVAALGLLGGSAASVA